MKLQKLPFFANGYHLAIFDKPLITANAQLWPYGPVYPSLYEALCRYGSGVVTDFICENDDNILAEERGRVVETKFSTDENRLTTTVWNAYKSYSAFKLSALTNLKGAPWSETKEFSGLLSDIPESVIRKYYKNLLENKQAG